MSPGHDQVNIYEVALRAGTSPYMVGRYLQGDKTLPSDIKAKIQKALAEEEHEEQAGIKEDFPAFLRHLHASESWDSIRSRSSITFASSNLQLTPDVFSNILVPYLQAINSLQKIIDDVEGGHVRDIHISEITQNSPISVSLDGAGSAIESIRNIVVPWQRRHYEIMASLEVKAKIAEIEGIKAHTLETRATVVKDQAEAQKLLAEAEHQRRESELTRVEVEKLKMEINREKIRLALEIINSIAPNISEEKKLENFPRMVKVVDVLTTSELEINTQEMK